MNLYNYSSMSDKNVELLKNILREIIDENKNLDFTKVKQIEIVNKLENISSDGKFENDVIILPMDKIESYIKCENINIIKSTIYHELCHAHLKTKLPFIHELSQKYIKEENYVKYFTIMVYIEYITHLMSVKYENKIIITNFLKSVNNIKWNFNNEESKIWYIKCLPYVLARTKEKVEYLNIIDNKEFKDNCNEAKEIFNKFDKNNLIDDYKILNKLEKYVSNYITNNWKIN